MRVEPFDRLADQRPNGDDVEPRGRVVGLCAGWIGPKLAPGSAMPATAGHPA